MADRPIERDRYSARRLRLDAYRLRLVEDFVSTKVRLLQHGRPKAGDYSTLARVHEAAVANIEQFLRYHPVTPQAVKERSHGLGEHSVAVVPYNPEWPRMFIEEAEKIRRQLGPLAFEIHHIGSTSIPGMPAKPLIDIAVSALPGMLPSRLNEYVSAMEGLGYRFYGDWGHRGGYYFAKFAASLRTFCVQLHTTDSGDLARPLLFRDAARADPSLFKGYAEVKVALGSALGRHRGAYYWYKAHWMHGKLLTDPGPADWGAWFFEAQYTTMFQFVLRSTLAALRPGPAGHGLHPMAIRRKR
jgi:GrpB-like predicted nucleotidyltransferase (UPF0157 family)